MNLHTNKELFTQAITATAQQMRIPEIYIEKDYWLTLALRTIFQSELTTDVVFKGGTALSKCYRLLERFSEDIDLVVIKHEGENDNQLKKKIKAITTLVSSVIPEVEVEGITHKVGMLRKTAHAYDHGSFEGEFGQVRQHIIVEATWLGSSEPYTHAEVNTYIADMMAANSQEQLIEKYGLQSFTVKVLTKQRTICEKIMSLVRFSHTNNPYNDLANKIRHIYDIHLMLKDEEVSDFFKNKEFDQMMVMVGTDDINSFRNNNDWLRIHPKDALIFTSPKETWEQIKTPYRSTFKDLVTGELPEESELINSLIEVTERLKTINWDIHIT